MSKPPSGPLAENQSPAQLKACPSRPNCVHSQASGRAAIAPFSVSAVTDTISQLVATLEADGAKVQLVTDRYVWATYTSRVFRFVDDIEFLMNEQATELHVRSASRLGYRDFNVNRERVERLRVLWRKAAVR